MMIEFKNVSFQYCEQKQVLHDLSFCIYPGEYVSIVGGNGSGKSTLVKLMNGLIQPTSGTVQYNQYDVQHRNDLKYIRQKVGMLFQNPEHQIVSTTVFEDVSFGLQNLGLPYEHIVTKVKSVLEQVGMLDHLTTDSHLLSGGQLQKVAIAGILAMEPDVLIMDESTSMLDPKGREDIFHVIHHLYQQGKTIISITHDMERVLEGTRVIIMEEGCIIQDGVPADLFKKMDWSSSALTAPFIIEIREQFKHRGVNLPDSLMTMNDLVEYMKWK